MEFEVVIGLETHVQLNTKSKIFCNCSTEFGAEPNKNVCPICMGEPGTLPVLNKEALKKAIIAGLSLNCEIAEYSKFDRKNYFYPDLPKGYQISQFDFPINKKGYIDIELPDNTIKRINITRAHLEEDAGKLIHVENSNYSYVDFNRAGTPLLEIVSEPDLRSSDEAYHYLKTLRMIMKYTEVSDVNMEEGSLRCDANVSIRPKGETKLGTKVEIKNMNSLSALKKAIDYEVERQINLYKKGEKIIQETRLYDATQNKTISMRSKEEANDYRYFPEPDIPPIILDRNYIEELRKTLPEFHYQKKKRFINEYNISEKEAETLVEDKYIAIYFEKVGSKTKAGYKKAANWILSEVLSILNERKLSIIDFEDNHCPPENISELLDLIEDNVISGKIAKEIFPEMLEKKEKASLIIERKGIKQITDTNEIEKIIDKVLSSNPAEVEKYKSGKKNILGFFVGEIMKETKGKANPKIVNEILRKKLD